MDRRGWRRVADVLRRGTVAESAKVCGCRRLTATFHLAPMDSAPRTDWDVIIMGGALAGSATACLLRRKNPELRVLILERSERLKRRVGESTVEISAYFLGRVLGLTDHLLEKHIPKQGMRFWFSNDRA